MKTWEMIKELTEHPEKKFTARELNFSLSAYSYPNRSFVLNTNMLNPKLDTDWQEVKQTVGWDEAIAHARETITHQIKYPGGTYEWFDVEIGPEAPLEYVTGWTYEWPTLEWYEEEN